MHCSYVDNIIKFFNDDYVLSFSFFYFCHMPHFFFLKKIYKIMTKYFIPSYIILLNYIPNCFCIFKKLFDVCGVAKECISLNIIFEFQYISSKYKKFHVLFEMFCSITNKICFKVCLSFIFMTLNDLFFI